jgi:SAM-dependent methyltransferase
MDARHGGRRLREVVVDRLRRAGPALGRRLPPELRRWVADAVAPPAAGAPVTAGVYERLYEEHAALLPPTSSIGAGDFDLIGRIELQLLVEAGLAPGQVVVDFGCGTGRLAVHLVPRLPQGRYVGVDIAAGMLEHAERLVRERAPEATCQVSWVKLVSPPFPLPDASVDFVCAFSVFTHMEHEDTFRYLRDAHRVVRPGGRFVFSCLPLDLAIARTIFEQSAQLDVGARWRAVRNVTTSVDLIEAVARLAGWEVERWYRGDEPNVDVPGHGPVALGQSTCVLLRP